MASAEAPSKIRGDVDGESVSVRLDRQVRASGLAASESATLTREGIVWQDADRVRGAVLFQGTRVPVALLFSWLGKGETMEDFLDNYPAVKREYAERIWRLTGPRAASWPDLR